MGVLSNEMRAFGSMMAERADATDERLAKLEMLVQEMHAQLVRNPAANGSGRRVCQKGQLRRSLRTTAAADVATADVAAASDSPSHVPESSRPTPTQQGPAAGDCGDATGAGGSECVDHRDRPDDSFFKVANGTEIDAPPIKSLPPRDRRRSPLGVNESPSTHARDGAAGSNSHEVMRLAA